MVRAQAFYVSVFPKSRVGRVTTPAHRVAQRPGAVGEVVESELFGQVFTAMSAGPLDPFNHAISFVVNFEDQAELDRDRSALLQGGAPEQCARLKDLSGMSWQIVPTVLAEMMSDRGRGARSARRTQCWRWGR